MFADEPTGNLDCAATLEVLRLFDTLREDGQTWWSSRTIRASPPPPTG